MRRALRWALTLGAITILALLGWRQGEGWRLEQRRFQELEGERLNMVLEAELERTGPARKALEERLAEEKARLAEEAGAVDPVRRRLRGIAKKARKAEAKEERQDNELSRALAAGEGAEVPIAELRAKLREARQAREELEAEQEEQQRRLNILSADVLAVEAELAESGKVAREIEEQLAGLGMGGFLGRLPLPRALDLSLERREHRPSGLPHPDPRKVGPRVDRCQTCHVVVDRPGYGEESWSEPFRSHPRLDLYLAEGTPHPIGQLGCTVCHAGDGASTSFEGAGHGTEIRSGARAQISCLGCHQDRQPRPETYLLNAGLSLVDRLGCQGCHLMEHPALASPRTSGPSLAGLSEKTTRAWAAAWIRAPRDLDSGAWMPHAFRAVGDPRQRESEIRAVVTTLWQGPVRPATEPAAGDRERGEMLFGALGCGACHRLDMGLGREIFWSRPERLRGPSLARLGGKVNPSWLYAWLRDPRGHDPEARMPDFRLSESEAADLTSFLLAGEPWHSPDLPPLDSPMLDALVLANLEEEHTLVESRARLAAMNSLDKEIYLGRRVLAREACVACHRIPAVESTTIEAPALGPTEGLSVMERESRLAVGLAHASGPDFALSGPEEEALLSLLMALTEPEIPASQRAGQDRAGLARAEGHLLVDKQGCRACHGADDGSASVGDSNPPPSVPSLVGIGGRVRGDWLFDYLRDPGQVSIRPWLRARMPTPAWTPGQRSAVVSLFAQAARAPLLVDEPEPVSRQSLAIGRAAYRLLQCGRCHEAGNAPDYRQARERLRREWVEGWILDPESHGAVPGGGHPEGIFEGLGARASDPQFLLAMLGTPIFWDLRQELIRELGSYQEVETWIAEPEVVAAGLRDYLWSLP